MKTGVLRKHLESLKPWQQAAFCVAQAERTWPNFALFSELSDFGEAADIRNCLDRLWEFVAGQRSAKQLERLHEKLDPNMPDPEAFDVYGVHPALDMIVGLTSALSCSITPDFDETMSSALLVQSTVGKFIKFSEVPDLKGTELNQYIHDHPLSVEQDAFFEELFELFKQFPNPKPAVAKNIRRLAQNETTSNIGITLE